MNNTKTRCLPKSAEFVLRIVGGSHALRIISLINLWLMKSGTEWTVSRLKAFWTASLQLRAGNHEVVRCIYRENSISYFKGTLIPRGPMGYLVGGFLNSQRPASLRMFAAGLRVYTALSLRQLSAKQFAKAKSAITGVSTGDVDAIARWSARVFVGAGQLNRQITGNLRLPDLSRLKAFSSTFSDFSESSASVLPYGKAVVSLINTCYIPEALKEVNPCEDLRQLLDEAGAESTTPGRISFIQERGAKARVVAVPNAWVQWLFEPLHRYLDDVIKTLPRSAVHDQNKGAYFVRNHMMTSESDTWCFDLSSATDRFPLVLQTQVLQALNLGTYAEALEEITHGWVITDSTGSTSDVWDYAVGQPMGLYGSFPLFHLTHYLLLEEVCKRCGHFNRDTEPFFVLGDDVIITDEEVANLYATTLKEFGVEISPSKTIQSSKVAEFAGFIGLKTNRSSTIFRPYKYGADERLNAPINLMYSLGSALGKTSPYWDKHVRTFGRTRSSRNTDLSPLIGCDKPTGKRAPKLDPPLLSNLLSRVYIETFPDDNSYYQGGGEDFVVDEVFMESCSSLFLGKKESISSETSRLPEELLTLPERDDEVIKFTTTQSIRHDPLMNEFNRESGRDGICDHLDTVCPWFAPKSRSCCRGARVCPASNLD